MVLNNVNLLKFLLKTGGFVFLLAFVTLVSFAFSTPKASAQQSIVDEVLPQLENFKEPNEARVDIYLRLAEAYLFTSPTKAIEVGNEILPLAKKLNYTQALTRIHLLIGRAYQFSGDLNEDLGHLNQALDIAKDNNDVTYTAEVYRNIGQHYVMVGMHAEALESFLEAISLAESQTNKRVLAASYFSLGGFYFATDKNENSEEFLQKALPIFEEIDEKRGMAVVIASLAEIYQKIGDAEKSQEYLNKSVVTFQELGDYLALAQTYIIFSRFEREKGDKKASLALLSKANKFAQQSKDQATMGTILYETGLLFLKFDQLEVAEAHFDGAIEIATDNNILTTQMQVYQSLAEVNKKLGKSDKAYEYLEKYNQVRETVYPLTYASTLSDIQTRFEREQKESELNSLRRIQAENTLQMEREQVRLNTAIMAVIFAILIVSVLAILYNFKNNAAKQMQIHNKQLLEIGKELEHVNRVKSDFLANTSHEIRTPLNGILGMVALLEKSQLDTIQREQLRAIELSGKKLLDLVNDLLDLTKIEAGKIDILYNPLNINKTLESELLIWNDMAKNEGLSFKAEIADNLPYLMVGAAARIIQVLTNLVGNAVKFTTEGNVILRISIAKDFGQEVLLHFEVEDTGIGIAKDKLSILFERFSQIDSGLSRTFQGTGLGLAISRDLVRIMNGSIGVESVKGEGSKFWFNLPLQVHTRKTPKNLDENAEKNKNKNGPTKRLKILIAEDNEINQAVIKGMIDHLGHESRFAFNGLEAIEKAQEEIPDIIFMDIQMPIMDGEQATKSIRAIDGPLAQVPIVAITANAMSGDAEKFLELGMDAYLAKPINMNNLNIVIQDMSLKIKKPKA